MGTSKSFAELGKKLEASARAIETKSDEVIVKASAMKAKTTISKRMRTAAPAGTLRAGRKGAPKRIGVRYDLAPDGKGAIVKATGPAHLIERPTKPHQIPKDLGGTLTHTASGRKRSAKSQAKRLADQNKKLMINGKVRTGPIKHPGTKGKYPFKKGTKDFLPSASATLASGVNKILRGVYG